MRSHWSNRWAFIMATAGSAVGLGNIWKFPYMTGTNGGSAFVLVYLLCVALIGVPLMMTEIMLGPQGPAQPGGRHGASGRRGGRRTLVENDRLHGHRRRHPHPLLLQRGGGLGAGLRAARGERRIRRRGRGQGAAGICRFHRQPYRIAALALGIHGWVPFELELLRAHGFEIVGMGARTLRTDTACIGLLSIVAEHLGA